MVRNVILRILSPHTSKSAENRPRKIDFTIFAVGGTLGWEHVSTDIWGHAGSGGKWSLYRSAINPEPSHISLCNSLGMF